MQRNPQKREMKKRNPFLPLDRANAMPVTGTLSKNDFESSSFIQIIFELVESIQTKDIHIFISLV